MSCKKRIKGWKSGYSTKKKKMIRNLKCFFFSQIQDEHCSFYYYMCYAHRVIRSSMGRKDGRDIFINTIQSWASFSFLCREGLGLRCKYITDHNRVRVIPSIVDLSLGCPTSVHIELIQYHNANNLFQSTFII